MKMNFTNAPVLLSPEQNETIRTVHCLLSDQPSLLFHIHQLDKRPARKSPMGASWGLRCSQIYILFSRALVTSLSSKPQWNEKTKIFTLCLSLIFLILFDKFSLFLKIIKPFYVAKQRPKGFP